MRRNRTARGGFRHASEEASAVQRRPPFQDSGSMSLVSCERARSFTRAIARIRATRFPPRVLGVVARAERKQTQFEFPSSWGGKRQGSGRKPKGERAGVEHRRRAPFSPRCPVHVTLRLVKGLPSLRRPREHETLLQVFIASSASGAFRVVHYSVQSNHLHLLCEALGRRALSRGLKGLANRAAARLKALWRRRGRVLEDRYHDHVLKTPSEVRRALAYVLNNARKHGIAIAQDDVDPMSSGRWFDGWLGGSQAIDAATPLPSARTWLLSTGWRRCSLVARNETPPTRAARRSTPAAGRRRSALRGTRPGRRSPAARAGAA